MSNGESELLTRFYNSLTESQRKNGELLCALEESSQEVETLSPSAQNAIATLRSSISETIKPNQTAVKEMEGLMKLLESRLVEIRAQEKHNEKQIITLEKERREVISQKTSLNDQRRMLTHDKEKMEYKLDQERAELLARAQKLTEMASVIENEPETLDAAVIQEAERDKLKSELGLMKKTEEIKGLEAMCESYQEEIKKVRDDAREAIKISESQAMEACKRLEQMNGELVKSQDTARKIQQLLIDEKEKNKELRASLDHERLQPLSRHMKSSLVGDTIEGNLSTIPGLSRALIQRAAKAGTMPTAVKVEELLRRNEALKDELDNTRDNLKKVQMELNKTKDDCKTASSKLHYATMQVSTLKQSRDDALVKMKRHQQNYDSLNKSLTRQASSWVQDRFDERANEDANRIKRLIPKIST